MCGRENRAGPLVEHPATAACRPDARLEIIEGCGHLSTVAQPDIVNRLLTDWRRETDPA